jgi:hypothetical protein
MTIIGDNEKKKKSSTTTKNSKGAALTTSQDVKNSSNPPETTGTGTSKTIGGLPVNTPVKVSSKGGFPGIPYAPDYKGPVYANANIVEGDAEKFFANAAPEERAALLVRLGQIPNAYAKGKALSLKQVTAMGNAVVWRQEDVNALKKVLTYQDQLGDATPNQTIDRFLSNPGLAASAFGSATGATKAITSAAALESELNSSFLDIFNVKVDKNTAKAYTKEINAKESSAAGLSSTEKKDIFYKYVQNKAQDLYNVSKTGAAPSPMDQGTLGRYVRNIRQQYDDNGIPVKEDTVFKQAVESLRSAEAAKNVSDSIMMSASTVMPAFKDYFARGITAKQALSPWITVRSQILEVPEDMIKVSDMYDVGAGTLPVNIADYKKSLYNSDPFKKTNTFKSRSLNDLQGLAGLFNIGGRR